MDEVAAGSTGARAATGRSCSRALPRKTVGPPRPASRRSASAQPGARLDRAPRRPAPSTQPSVPRSGPALGRGCYETSGLRSPPRYNDEPSLGAFAGPCRCAPQPRHDNGLPEPTPAPKDGEPAPRPGSGSHDVEAPKPCSPIALPQQLHPSQSSGWQILRRAIESEISRSRNPPTRVNFNEGWYYCVISLTACVL